MITLPSYLRSKNGLAKQGAAVSLGQGMFALGQFAILSLTASVLGVVALGEVALTAALVTPIMTVVGLRLRVLVQTDETSPGRFYLLVQMGSVAVGVLLCLGVAAAVSALTDMRVVLLAGCLAIARGMDQFVEIAAAKQLRDGRVICAFACPSVNGAATAVAVSIFLAVNPNVSSVGFGSMVGSAMGLIAIPFAFFGSNVHILGQLCSIRFSDQKHARSIIARATPLALSSGTIAISASLGRLLVAGLGSLSLLGQYTALYSIVGLFSIPTSGLAQVSLSRQRNCVKSGDLSEFRASAWRMRIAVGLIWIGLSVGSAAIGPSVLVALFGVDAQEWGTDLLIWALASLPFFLSWALETEILALGLRKNQLYASISGAIANLALLAILVPFAGVIGAGLAFGISQSIRATMLAIQIRKKSSPTVAMNLDSEQA